MQYKLVRSKKRRRSVAMQVTSNGEVVVRAPVRMPQFFIDRFVREHEKWIEKQMKEKARPKPALVEHFDSQESLESFIRAKTSEYSEIISLKPARIRFTKVKTYWGSCSPDGVISFNRHLLYAPPEAVEYVVVHELCHLKYRGHGKRFWDLVTKYFPRANDMRKVLRHIARD